MTLSQTERENQTEATHQRKLVRLLPLAITFFAGLFCYGLFYNRSAWLSVIGYSVSPAERVMQGEVPYRDFLYNYTPGILWLNALLMRLFGTALLTVHKGLLIFKLATLLVLYLAAKRLLGAWAALVPVALALSWIGYKYIFGVFPTQYSMLFILLGLIFMLKYNDDQRLAFLLASGLCVGLVFLFKYNVGILLLGCASLAIVIRELTIGESTLARCALLLLKKASIYWAGFAIALLPLLYYLVRNHALRAMLDHFIHHASAYGEERAVPLPPLKWLAPTGTGLIVVIALGGLLIRKAQTYFRPFLIVVFLLAAIALLIPGRAFIVKNSAIVFMAYLPIFLFVSIAIILLWQWRKETGKAKGKRQKAKGKTSEDVTEMSEVRSQKSEVRSGDSGVRSQESEGIDENGEIDFANESPHHLFTSSPLQSSDSSPLQAAASSPPLPASTPPPFRNWWQSNGEVVIVGLFALGAYLEMYPRADYYHLVRSLPPTFLLIALAGVKVLPWLRNSLSTYLPASDRALMFSCGVAVALLMLVGIVNTWQPNFDARFRLIDRTPLGIERGQGILVPPKQAEFVTELTDLITQNSSPDESVFSFGQRGAGFYFLSGRRNPTKFVWWRNVGIRREDRESVLQMIGEKRAKLILLQDSLKDARVRDAVNANYHKVGAASGIGVFDRNE
jgi:membrane protein implicated in regulation of membrane protease activity